VRFKILFASRQLFLVKEDATMRFALIDFSYTTSIVISVLVGFNHIALSQIIEDQTLPQSSISTSRGNQVIITGGTQRGGNLFHSFREFSVRQGETASFQNISPETVNIFTRVTGNFRSNIDGTIEALQSNGRLSSANFFLLNPNGILFGRNASLNVGGSFLATTAESINFADGIQFSAANPTATSLLTVSVPVGLQFGNSPGNIINQSVVTNLDSAGNILLDPGEVPARGLRVFPGNTLALVGGNIYLQGGGLVAGGGSLLESNNTAPSGRVEIGSVVSPDQVRLTQIPRGWDLDFSAIRKLGNVRLSQSAFINANGAGGGAIEISGRQIAIADGSQILSVTQGLGSGEAIVFNASNDVSVVGSAPDPSSKDRSPSGVFTLSFSAGNAGDVDIFTRQLVSRNGAAITSETYADGRGGNINIQATESFAAIGGVGDRHSSVYTATYGSGKSGNLEISTQRLLLQQGGRVGSQTLGNGSGGNVRVSAPESVSVSGVLADTDDPVSSLFTLTESGAGRTGRLIVDTAHLTASEGGQIASTTRSAGQAGQLIVRANEIDFSGIALNENGDPLLVRFPGEELPLPFPSGLFSGAESVSTGNGGSLRVTAQRLRLSNGAVIQSNTFSSGRAGNLDIRVSDRTDIIGTSIDTLIPSSITAISGGLPGSRFRSVASATGVSGNITLQTPQLNIRDGGAIAVSSINSKAAGAGRIDLQAGAIALNDAQINANTESGSGANIRIRNVDIISLQQNARITASAGVNKGGGNGGNILINRDRTGNGFIIASPRSNNDILADADEGAGGNIDITTQGIFGITQRPESNATSDISASSRTGIQGTVRINQVDIDPTQGLTELSPKLASAEPVQGCQVTGGQAIASFFNTGRGGLPPTPYEPLSSVEILDDVRLPSPDSSSATPQTQSDRPIVEANGWIVGDNGKVMLMTTVPNTQSQGLCHLR
jgi:filamentous hemagglutinin family protein